MSGPELKSMREYLGLTTTWLAAFVSIGERRIQRMEVGQEEIIPDEIAGPLDDIYEETNEMVDRLVGKYKRLLETRDTVEFPVYRDDGEYRRANPAARYPARWHRMVARRLADAAPGVVLVYKEPYRVDRRPWLENNGKRGRERSGAER
jgi:hypothetical protein